MKRLPTSSRSCRLPLQGLVLPSRSPAVPWRAGGCRSRGPAGGRQADVPVKQVVLFSSGVGYFEHFGTVNGTGDTELRFKTQQINDILKSLVLEDLDKGQVTTITYPSQDPVAKTLRSFQVDITTNPSLGDLLNQLRGAKVKLLSRARRLKERSWGWRRSRSRSADKDKRRCECGC